jgi:hypothetical protein
MFYSVLTCSIFPEAWKMSKILPVPKIPKAGELYDYRSISLLPALSKALEDACVTKSSASLMEVGYSVLANLIFALVTSRPRLL